LGRKEGRNYSEKSLQTSEKYLEVSELTVQEENRPTLPKKLDL